VLVVEREREAGGIPRHAQHTGFGMRDLYRVLNGPDYARRLTEQARGAGAQLLLGTQVTGWGADGTLELTGPEGRQALRASAVVLATGCRERPRSARDVPGSRPEGVMTTGTLQQRVYLNGERVGRRAVIVGAEHVSFSAVVTLAHAGARAVAMVTELPYHQSLQTFRVATALRFRTPLYTHTELTAVHGRDRVDAVEVTDLRTGASRRIECDTVVFTAGWIPDHELAVLAGAELDPGTRGPRVDFALRTSRPGLFAAGNLLHGAETADVAALSGRHVAAAVAGYLGGEPWPEERIELRVESPLHWVAPNALVPPVRRPPRGALLLRAREELQAVQLEIVQAGRSLETLELPRVLPGRSVKLGVAWTRHVDPAGGPVTLRIVSNRAR
jgi:thioredoxin reductase